MDTPIGALYTPIGGLILGVSRKIGGGDTPLLGVNNSRDQTVVFGNQWSKVLAKFMFKMSAFRFNTQNGSMGLT